MRGFFLLSYTFNAVFFMSLSLESLLNKSSSSSIAIIGGGASATLLLHRLSEDLSRVSTPIDIYLFDEQAGRQFGPAYSTEEPTFLLNVPAANMGADVNQPEDFYNWLRDNGERWRNLHPSFKDLDIGPQDFAPRMIYAEYLHSLLEDAKQRLALKNIQLHLLLARVTRIETREHPNIVQLHTDVGLQLFVNKIILCTGNATPNHADLANSHAMPPYSQNFLKQDWSSIKDIAILGSGLSMVDAIQYLLIKGYKGHIHAFSRQGLIPLPHTLTTTKAPAFDISNLTTARAIANTVRCQIKENALQGITWQDTINSLRQHVNQLWLSLAENEKQKLQRFMPWWNITRHRIAEPIYRQLKELQNSGKLTLIKGKVVKAESDGEYILAHMSDKIIFIRAEKLILCSGYACNYPQLQLLCNNLLDIPQLQAKLSCAQPDYKISSSHEIYALGPALTGVLFETTAIHEIRQQSAAISTALARQLHALNAVRA